MNKSICCFVATYAVLFFTSPAVADDESPIRAGKPVFINTDAAGDKADWKLWLVKDKVGFLALDRPSPQGAPALPTSGGQLLRVSRWVRSDGMLRLFVMKCERENTELAAKDGWYLTADYSHEPPTVGLTKEPTTHSKWAFVDAKGPYSGSGTYCFIKNETDLDKERWLSMDENGEFYKNSELRLPVLSFTKRIRYFVQDADDGK